MTVTEAVEIEAASLEEAIVDAVHEGSDGELVSERVMVQSVSCEGEPLPIPKLWSKPSKEGPLDMEVRALVDMPRCGHCGEEHNPSKACQI